MFIGDSRPSVLTVFSPRHRIDVEFHDNFFNCPYGDENSPACTAYTGNFVMDQLGIPRDYVTTASLALMGFALFYMLTAWLFLQFLPVKISFSKQVKSNERENDGTAEAVARAKSAEQRPTEITIRVQDLRLVIDKRNMFKRSKVDILQGITTDFEPGKLNVIMGPSGMAIVFEAYDRIRKKQFVEYFVSTITWFIHSTVSLLCGVTVQQHCPFR